MVNNSTLRRGLLTLIRNRYVQFADFTGGRVCEHIDDTLLMYTFHVKDNFITNTELQVKTVQFPVPPRKVQIGVGAAASANSRILVVAFCE